MPRLTVKPPNIGLPLLLSAILSTTSLGLCVFAKTGSTPPLPSFVPISVALNSSYYLIRYLHRRAIVKHDSLAGDAWPFVPFFPGMIERFNYQSYPIVVLVETILFGLGNFTRKRISSMQLTTALYFLGLVMSAVVYMQATRVRKQEDAAMCTVAHGMRCISCWTEITQVEAPLPTDLHLRAMAFLPLSMAMSLALCGMIFVLAPAEPDIMWALFAFAALAAMHRLFFFIHSRSARPAEWPITPIFPGIATRIVLHSGNMFIATAWLFAVCVVPLEPGRLAWERGMLQRAIWVVGPLIAVLDHILAIRGVKMHLAETRVTCMRDGHHWKCLREGCGAQNVEACGAGTNGMGQTASAKIEDGTALSV